MLLDVNRQTRIAENMKQAQHLLKDLPEEQQITVFSRNFHALAKHHSNFQLCVETEGHSVEFDQSLRNAGDATAPCPMSMLMASIAACLEMNWVVLLTLSQVAVEDVKVRVEGTLDGRYNIGGRRAPPARLQSLDITSILRTYAPREKIENLFEKAIAMCPVGGSLHADILKSYRLEIVQP